MEVVVAAPASVPYTTAVGGPGGDEEREEAGVEAEGFTEEVWSWFMAKGGMSCLRRPLADACSAKL